ncbi:sulfatase family protein, partial [Vibrio parahaemolyticus V-223/04]
TIR